jgi:hypothetical protein
MIESARLPRDDRDPRETEIGLMLRLIAAGWFAVAAFVPVAGFIVFASQGNSNAPAAQDGVWFSLWFFFWFPISLAAFYGFVIGSRILDLERLGPGRATLRGMAVAVLSYLSMPAINGIAAMLFSPRLGAFTESRSSVLYWLLVIYGVGAVMVGWIIVIVGAIAGLLLDKLSTNEIFRQIISDASRVTKEKKYRLNGLAALILLAANAFLMLVSWPR